MKRSRIHAVDHVEIEAPLGSRDDLRWFYGEVAGLEELEEATVCAGDSTELRFKSARLELRVRLVADPDVDPVALRLTVFVRSLSEVAGLLEERGHVYERSSGIMYTDRRLLMHDPAGHRVALKREWPEITF